MFEHLALPPEKDEAAGRTGALDHADDLDSEFLDLDPSKDAPSRPLHPRLDLFDGHELHRVSGRRPPGAEKRRE